MEEALGLSFDRLLMMMKTSCERSSFHTLGRVGIPEVSFGPLNAVLLVNVTVTDFKEN